MHIYYEVMFVLSTITTTRKNKNNTENTELIPSEEVTMQS